MKKAYQNAMVWGAGLTLLGMSAVSATAQEAMRRIERSNVSAGRPVDTPAVISAVSAFTVDGEVTRFEPGEQVMFRQNGGIAGMTCVCDLDCADGDPCTADTCDENGMCQQNTIDALGRLCEDGDGDFCTNGQCDEFGSCIGNGAGDSCDVDEVCDEIEDECDGTECTMDGECSANDDPDNCLVGTCEDGRCGTESLCADGELCDGMGVCEVVDNGRCCTDLNACALTTLAACDGGAGPWSSIWDCDCPKYSAGQNNNAGQEFNFLVTAADPPCENFSRVGDDYEIANGSYLNMTALRFVGGPATTGTGNGSVSFEVWDSAVDPPVLVGGFFTIFTGACDAASDNEGAACGDDGDCPNGSCDPNAVLRGSRFWTIGDGVSTILTIPPNGYFAIRPTAGSAETVGILSTNDVGLIGNNDPDILFFNDSNTGAFLSPDFPDILAFEFVGTKVDPPTGACCFGEGMCQDDDTVNTSWLCNAAGGNFVAGTTCLDDPCGTASCCFPDGSCTVESAPSCTGSGGTVGTFGGNCDPNCCLQPDTQGNSCGEGPVQLVDVASDDIVTLTVSGDNSLATNGTCSISGTPCRTYQADGEDCPSGETCDPTGECLVDQNDVGAYQSFELTANANVEISYCCTDSDSPVTDGAFVRWIVLVDDCDSCNVVFRDGPGSGCTDGNPSDNYVNLSAGTYHYSVYGERYCLNSPGTQDCVTDSDCLPGEGPCGTQAGPYQLQITATRLPTQACCLADACIDNVDQLECEALGGVSLDGVPLCVPVNPCVTGSCCLGAGMCDDNGGSGITRAACEVNPSGQYIGGALCADDPCPVCEIEDTDNCQFDNGQFILVHDRALWADGAISRWVDDFQATTSGPLDRVCWWPAFFNPFDGTECSAPGEPPADDWVLRIFADDGGVPGAEIGVEQVITPDAKVSLGATSRVWQYSGPVAAPPILSAGECYWLEINGAGEGEGGCTIYSATSADGNSYVINDNDGVFGPEDIVTSIGSNPPSTEVDIGLCVSTGMNSEGCGEFTGACCLCNGTCSETTITACDGTDGFFFPGETCGSVTCPETFVPGDDCGNNVVLTHDGGDPANDIPVTFDIRCASTDGPNQPFNGCSTTPGGTPTINDVWYEYTAPCCGTLTASMCPADGGGTDFDSQLVAYSDGSDTCVCPVDLETAIVCGDSTCGIPGGPSSVELEAEEGDCYLFRVAGAPEIGTGSMIVSIACTDCPSGTAAPFADDRFDINGTVKACATDQDCKNGATGPDAQTVCRDGACYVARQRYLSLLPNVENAGLSYTYRVSLDTGVAGEAVLGFAGQPSDVTTSGPGPNLFHLTRIIDSPHYMDWTTLTAGYVTIGDCEVSPGNAYIVQSIIEGADTGDESNYSIPLALPTPANNGDVTGGGSPGTPPNGAQGTLVDVFAMIQGFQNNQNEPKDWLDIEPNTGAAAPNLGVSLADAFAGVQAFQQLPYPGPAPLDCP